MQEPSAPRLQPYHPTTFLERGVAVPFTTPLLAGTRARPMERGGTELIVPNPSGGPGAYVLPWNVVRDLCRPTLHDIQLNEHVAALPAITPSGIRRAARAIAAEGLAGRAACAAATQADSAEQQDRLLTNFLLLLELVKQGEPPGHNRTLPEEEQPALLERRARRVIGLIAPALAMTPDRIACTLEELAGIFSPIGIGRHIPKARLTRLLDSLARVRAETIDWSLSRDEDSALQAAMIADVANMTLSCARAVMEATRALIEDLPALLRQWNTKSDPVAQRLARPDWLLDGWEQICLVWNTCGTDATRRAALAEMALMVPIIPREALTWMDGVTVAKGFGRHLRQVKINQDWRTGLIVFDLIARNERIRSMAA